MSNMKSTSANGSKCPYWALESSSECGIAKGGMYIPMPEHVKMFCLSTNHFKCSQYIKGCEVINGQNETEANEFLGTVDRRRLRRYPEQLYLDLVVCDRNTGLSAMNSCKAKSLDVSLGGIRIESPEEFTRDSVVSFMLDPEFSSDELLGVGEVKWCVPKKDSGKYEAGVAFSNYSTSESMREYLRI